MKLRKQVLSILCVGMLAFVVGCTHEQAPTTGKSEPTQETKVNKDAETSKVSQEKVKMAFFVPTEDGSGVKQTTVEMEANKVTPKAALLAMLNADRAQKYPVFSKDIEITSVTVKDGIASVEVNDAFVKGNGGDLTVKLQMAAIVNTLTSFDNINGVLFVNNGKKVPTVGSFDTKEPVKRISNKRKLGDQMQLKDVGEFNFIRQIQDNTIYNPNTVVYGIGDDCAIYKAEQNTEQLISTDTMVEGVHFSFHYMMPYDVGYRLMTANLSDVAAMGGIPRQIVLSVAAPDHVDTVILDEIYRGIKDQCMRYQLNILGGDTVRTEGPMVWTVTIIGEVPKGTAVMRSGAKVGDVVGVTNYVGYAATGLGALSYNLVGYDMTKVGHQRPEPQIELGQKLRQLGIHSMNDISDGLGSELNEIATASNVSIVFEEQAIPLHEETYELAKHLQTNPVDYALYGGEDFQLVFTAPKSLLSE